MMLRTASPTEQGASIEAVPTWGPSGEKQDARSVLFLEAPVIRRNAKSMARPGGP